MLMPNSPRMLDTDFLLLVVSAGVATFVDIESTVRAQLDPEAEEVNSWIYGERPGRGRMYGVNLLVTFGLTALSHTLRKDYPQGKNCSAWQVPLVALVVGHSAAAIANLINFRPSLRRML